MHDIFLSYSSADRERVRPLYDALKLQGWTVFWDHATIQTGEQWSHIIEANLNASDCVIVVWTANSVKSEYVLDEATRARNRNILIPVSLDQTPPPIGFGMRQTTDLGDWDGKTDHPKFAAISRPLLDKMRFATQTRLAAFKQQQTELAQTQSQLQQQRDELAKQSQSAQQTQAELAHQAAELEKQRTELARQVAQGAEDFAPKLAAAQQRAKELNAQLETAREQCHLAEQAQRAAEVQQRTADLARQTAENQLRAAQLTQQSQQSEFVQLNQQLADQHRELTTLRARPPVEVEKVVEKLVEKTVVKEVRSPKDKLIGVVIGGVLVAATWGVMGNHSAPADNTPAAPIASAPAAPVVEPAKTIPEPAKPVEDKEQKRLAAIQHAKDVLHGDDKTQWQAAAQALADPALAPLDNEAMRLLGMSYEAGIQGQPKNFAQACPWYQRAAKAGNQKAIVHLQQLRKEQKCKN